MSEYSDRMKAHLTRYKRERLGVTEDGIWQRNGRAYPHILPVDRQRLNVLETIRREFWEFADESQSALKLHTDFHHLNSSQAFAFNLFFPWMGLGQSPDPVLRALGVTPKPVRRWAFEHMPDLAERTAIDFHVEFNDGTCLLVEVKLTEGRFGACEPNDAHRRKLRETYTSRLRSAVEDGCLEESIFFPSYQLFRNVSHLDLARGDSLALVVPRGNRVPWEQGMSFRETRLRPGNREAVRLVAVEDLLETLLEAARDLSEKFRTHHELLREKYSPSFAAGSIA